VQLGRLWLLGVLAVTFGAVVPTGSARFSPMRTSAAGTLVFGAEQGGGPDWCLNQHIDVDCSAAWNTVFEAPVIRGAFLLTPKFRYKPDLISRNTLQTKPLRLTYYIRKNARWSDGVPVTAQDFRFTWLQKINPKYNGHITTEGWEDISDVAGRGKVVRITFKKTFAAWRALFDYVLPAHALEGEDLTTVWEGEKGIVNPKSGKPIGDGPFVMTKFDRGCCITLARNPGRWHGSRAKLRSIVFRFITNTNSELQAMRSGEVDAIYPTPQPQLAELRRQHGLKVQSNLGLGWEHIEIQQGAKGNPLAKRKWARQALISALNRSAATRAVFASLNPRIKVLNSLTRLTNMPGYRPSFGKWAYSPRRVASIMRAHGCAKAADGIFRCGGTKFSFDLSSTAGNGQRELAFTILQAEAAKAGVELRNAFAPAGTFFANLAAHNFDLGMFGYRVALDPHYDVSLYACDGDGNITEYCNGRVTALLKKSDLTLNLATRIKLVNRADKIMADDVPMIPLFQAPTYFVYKASVHGIVDNAGLGGPSWNAEAWSKG
jgi:peptide/nickel transport system substrate-binding protein